MFTTMKRKKETKNLTYCDDCHSVIDVDAEMGSWVKCPHCNTQFRFTKRVVKKG